MPAKNKFIRKIVGNTFATIVFCANLVFICLLLLSMLAWTVSPIETTKFAYLGLSFPFILAAILIFLLFWILFSRWKLAIVNIAAIAICWSPISTYVALNFKSSSIPNDCIKVLSYNVRGFNWLQGKKARENPIFDYLTSSNADIICLQEFAATNQSKNKKGLITEAEMKQILKDYPYSSFVRFGHRTANSFGVACYSKFPIERTVHIPAYSTYNGSVLYEININGQKVTLINNHLESNRITAEDKKLYQKFVETKDRQMIDEVTNSVTGKLGIAYQKRAVQADTIASWAARQKKVTDATIICGDFNDTPISYAYHKIKGDLIDSFSESGLGQGITYHENMFWFRIDFIMHSSNIKSFNSTVDKVKYSDHYPIWTYLQFK